MSLRRFFATSVLASTFTLTALAGAGCTAAAEEEEEGAAAGQAATVARPPQFVLLAFDGSYNNGFWEESRAFAQQTSLKFTYFISSVYYVARPNNASYQAPRQRQGASNIGWGDDSADIERRLAHTRAAVQEGHEIASHAAGHYDGSAWSESEWMKEFESFDTMLFNAPRTAGLSSFDMGFASRDVVGFRAPQLGHSRGLFATLANKGFTYDTSKVDAPDYWPQKVDGVWNFPLARLRIVGSGKATLSMDYNFFVADSRGSNDAVTANHAKYERQMVDTYMQYFQSNYYGNRAPVHIGHHFSKWNGGAYWKAMQTFARRVCGLPEVKCVTYKELVSFVEENGANLRSYQSGDFPKLARPPSAGDSYEATQPVDDSELPPADAHEAHDEGADEG